MNPNDFLAANSLVWPLCFLLMSLLILRQLRDDVRPIVHGMTGALAAQAARYSAAWAMAGLYACAASFQALAEVAAQLGWVYVAAFAKVTQPAFVAIIAFVSKSPGEALRQATNGASKAPFTSTQATNPNP